MTNKTVLNLSAIDRSGAGTFAVNFHGMLLAAGYDSYMVVKKATLQDSRIREYPKGKFEQPIGKLTRQIAKWQWSETDFEYDRYFYGLHMRQTTVSAEKILSLLPARPQVIFIHWIANFVNTKIIAELHRLTGAKIIWLMLDNAPITGGCHFPWDCRHFTTTCYDCPAILDPKKRYLAEQNLAFKKQYLTAGASICVFSQNDFDRAKASALFADKKIMMLPGYFVDEKKFSPGDRAAAKASFGIPADHKVIFFGAVTLGEKRKGMAIFIDAIARVRQENVTVLIAGSSKLPLQLPNMLMAGNLTEAQLIEAYRAADMFVCPTLEDSGPTMINQAITCGTPVVSFEAGLGRDLVHTGQTGYRAALADAQDLARGIESILDLSASEWETMSANCRQLALDLYGPSEEYPEKLRAIIGQ